MLRKITGIAAGFVVWTLIWLAVDPLVHLLAPGIAPNADLTNMNSTFLLIVLAASIVCSVVSGFVAVLISKELSRTTLILGFILLVFGLVAEISMWNLLPLWYHLAFLILLIPMTILGGKLKKF